MILNISLGSDFLHFCPCKKKGTIAFSSPQSTICWPPPRMQKFAQRPPLKWSWYISLQYRQFLMHIFTRLPALTSGNATQSSRRHNMTVVTLVATIAPLLDLIPWRLYWKRSETGVNRMTDFANILKEK